MDVPRPASRDLVNRSGPSHIRRHRQFSIFGSGSSRRNRKSAAVMTLSGWTGV